MKKVLIYIMAVASIVFASCDPVEDRQKLSGGITAEQLNISAVPEIRDGMNSNYVQLNSDGNATLSSWDYGTGTFVGTQGRVQLLLKGENEIIYSGLNGDGSKITKTLTVQVDNLYDVAPEWGYFCGNGEKTWVWEDKEAAWGNGGYLANTAPGWWTVQAADMEEQSPGEGANAEMIFKLRGKTFIKKKSDGTSEQGVFDFDMTKTTENSNGDGLWGTGKFTLRNATILAGFLPNQDNQRVYEYDILKLNDDQMILGWPEPGAAAWGTAWYAVFKAKDR